MVNNDMIIESSKEFYDKERLDKNGRYRSWDYCYKCFYDARFGGNKDIDYLCLMLAFYLASWGMYRGSSFLLGKDYLIHKPVVEKILRPDYDCLLDVKWSECRDDVAMDSLWDLNSSINSYYVKVREEVKGKYMDGDISSTLITKILLGTLGCVPAYDRLFVEGKKTIEGLKGGFNPTAFPKLISFYKENKYKLDMIRKYFTIDELKYPEMKVLDMVFWKLGLEKENKKKKIMCAD